jgi:Tat protein secretion system quality control protein TatD with DNase activity
VAHTARALAQARAQDLEELAAVTTANFETLLGLHQLN